LTVALPGIAAVASVGGGDPCRDGKVRFLLLAFSQALVEVKKMRMSLVLAIAFAFASVISASSKAETVVYDNTANLWTGESGYGTVLTWSGGGVEWGDEVNLAGSARVGKQLEVLTYCSGATAAGTVLSLYDNTGVDGAPNNLLWTTDLGVVNYSGTTPVIAALSDVLLPDTVTWTVRLYGSYDYLSLGPILYDPPTVGSSGDWYWYNWCGSGFTSDTLDWGTENLPANFAAKITAVPEPSTLALLSIGAAAILAHYRSRRNRSRVEAQA
jgi:hypothetical protein